MKQIIITIPDNCELKKDGNTYIIVEKEKNRTYDDIAKKLFRDTEIHYYITTNGDIFTSENTVSNRYCKTNTTSRKQAEKLLAINKLMNVAKYLNGDWQPDWYDIDEDKYYIDIDYDEITIHYVCSTKSIDVYFKSRELAKQAIEILGEETIRFALCTDY